MTSDERKGMTPGRFDPAKLGEKQLAFPPAEYDARQKKIKSLLQRERIDLLWMTTPEAVAWTHGYVVSWYKANAPMRYPQFYGTAIPAHADGLVHFDNPSEETILARTSVSPENKFFTSREPDEVLPFIVAELKSKGWLKPGTRIGMEFWSYLPNRAISEMVEQAFRAAGAEIVDASSLVREARRVKSEAELAKIREAVRLCDIGHATVAGEMRPGMTELELFGLATAAMMKAGSGFPALIPIFNASPVVDGEPQMLGHAMAGRHALKEGEILETKHDLELVADSKSEKNPFLDKKSGTRFDIAGRGIEGDLKSWTLAVPENVVCKWFAWSAENPSTTLYQAKEPAPAIEEKKEPAAVDPKQAIVEITGTSEFLRAIPKKFATVQSVDAKARKVTLLIDGEKEAKAWPLTLDAEVKIAGWWGRVGQLKPGERVWAWFHSDRKKNPTSIFMIADAASEKDIHISKDSGDLEAKRKAQQIWLRDRWLEEGLPGTIAFVHVAGEAEVMLDHEAMRWARSLKLGDKVKLAADPPIAAVVKDMKPWRERTQVRLVVNGLDIAELQSGQRTLLKMTAPAKEIQESDYPPDLGQKRSKEERIDWFLASIYCTCKIANDICTGDFYTLASCNPNGCGMPNATRRKIASLIDKGLDDKQVWDDLRVERGELMTRPHLVK